MAEYLHLKAINQPLTTIMKDPELAYEKLMCELFRCFKSEDALKIVDARAFSGFNDTNQLEKFSSVQLGLLVALQKMRVDYSLDINYNIIDDWLLEDEQIDFWQNKVVVARCRSDIILLLNHIINLHQDLKAKEKTYQF